MANQEAPLAGVRQAVLLNYRWLSAVEDSDWAPPGYRRGETDFQSQKHPPPFRLPADRPVCGSWSCWNQLSCSLDCRLQVGCI